MGGYISRDVIDARTETVPNGTVTANVRTVGGKVIVEAIVSESGEAGIVSRTRIAGVVREAAKSHLDKVGTPRLMSNFSVIRESNSLDENGHNVKATTRVRTQTFVLGK